MPEFDTERGRDELSVKIDGGMRLAKIRGGGMRITHSSGRIDIVSSRKLSETRSQLVADAIEIKRQIAAFDAEFE